MFSLYFFVYNNQNVKLSQKRRSFSFQSDAKFTHWKSFPLLLQTIISVYLCMGAFLSAKSSCV